MIDDFKQHPLQKRTKSAQLTGFSGSKAVKKSPPRLLEEPGLDDMLPEDTTLQSPILKDAPSPEVKPPRQKFSKKKLLLVGLITLLALASAGFGAWWFGMRDDGQPVVTKNFVATPIAAVTPVAPAAAKTAVAALSGLDVDPAIASRPVTGIMIENSGEARPQAGLIDADIVFEAIAEGGITRYLALFQSKQPDYIGPIRSARPYYVEWARTFDAAYIHAGGSPDGLAKVTELGVKDLSAFSDSDVFFRISQRFAPHNLYSSTKGIDDLEKARGFTKSDFTPWPRKIDVPQPVLAKTINLNISSEFYNASYTYDAATNSYLRTLGGQAHKDDKSSKQLSPKVVMAIVTDRSQDGIYSVYKTTGSGKLYVFQDGVASQGTWSKSSASSQFEFKDQYGFEMKLNKGQAWVSVVANDSDVTFAP